MENQQAGRIGSLDKALRIGLAIVLLGFALFCPFAQAQGPVVVWLSGLFGATLLVTALIGKCPIYRLFGKHT